MGGSKKFYWLDWVRFIAAFAVVMVHARGAAFVPYGSLSVRDQTPLVWSFFAVTRIGNEAVVAFFVLSGFLVGGKVYERVLDRTFIPAEYIIDRAARIFLPLLPVLMLTALYVAWQHKVLDIPDFIGNLLSLQGVLVKPYGGNAPLWSLAYEVWFYVLVGALGTLAMRRGGYVISIFLIALVALIFCKLSVNYLLCWLIGVLAYIYRPIKIYRRILFLSIVVIIGSIFFMQIGFDSMSMSGGLFYKLRQWIPSVEISRVWLSLGIAGLIQQLALMSPASWFGVKFENIGTSCAAFSYSLYLSHYLVIRLAFDLGIQKSDSVNHSSVENYLVVIVLCVVVAWVLYFLSERHTQTIRRYLRKVCETRP